MKQQQGFTLIELIIVIVILGILAVTAAPRFIDIQSDARKEVLQGVKAALQGGAQLVYAKSAIAGVQKVDSSNVALSPTISVATQYGYPDGGEIAAAADFQKFVDLALGATEQLRIEDLDVNDETIRIRYSSITSNEGAAPPTGCFVEYTSALGENTTPTITVRDNGC